ncbi:tellurite resistance/C4-dicarboxylate transporter family protein [Leekyejoonella antrihumi]|uniref:Tellurite resistance protein permease n=1 Tax=Leekyejoonella antrihumi TaxID=1660198 RepID=A0A563E0T5_9MICO|nr:tellurite resistance/C4-dicarboxylate transporter family protein [Leekyejoonella antrihumi]TWP35811.1 tellurite resistance protein permease [Leekyejoonella antrihumi]
MAQDRLALLIVVEPRGTPAGSVRDAVSTLNPGYFALVMGTGIISVAMRNNHVPAISIPMFAVAAASWIVLVVLHCWRAAHYWQQLRADFTDPRRAFGFFTFVAATEVLGTRSELEGYRVVAMILLVLGLVSWFVLGYIVPWTAVLNPSIRPALTGANGSWFIWVVASQSVAVLTATLEPTFDSGRHELALIAVFSWAVGAFLYAGVGVLVIARLLLYPLRAEDFTPVYWVAMGATAITVLAGARIVQMADAPMVAATRGLIAGSSVMFWAFGTWLVPVLCAAAWWRHITHRIPLVYEATLWSIIFPLGMYAVASYYLGHADRLPIVRVIGDVMSWISLIAWAAVFVAMIRHLTTHLVLRRPGTSGPQK